MPDPSQNEERIPYRVERTRNRHSRAVLMNDTIVIRLARRLSEREEQRHIESLVRRMVKMLERDRRRIKVDPFFPIFDGQALEVEALVQQINAQTLNVPIRRIRLRPMTSQWGSCSHRGHITLNTALLKLPRCLLEYVIVHELAHRLVKDHSRRFWNLVESVCAQALEARKELCRYRICRK